MDLLLDAEGALLRLMFSLHHVKATARVEETNFMLNVVEKISSL